MILIPDAQLVLYWQAPWMTRLLQIILSDVVNVVMIRDTAIKIMWLQDSLGHLRTMALDKQPRLDGSKHIFIVTFVYLQLTSPTP